MNLNELVTRVEQEHDCTILYATLAGSRAAGTHHEQSDWDIRGLFLDSWEKRNDLFTKPRTSVRMVDPDYDEGRGLDAVFWSIPKAFPLLAKGNYQMILDLTPVEGACYSSRRFLYSPKQLETLINRCFVLREALYLLASKIEHYLKKDRLDKAEECSDICRRLVPNTFLAFKDDALVERIRNMACCLPGRNSDLTKSIKEQMNTLWEIQTRRM